MKNIMSAVYLMLCMFPYLHASEAILAASTTTVHTAPPLILLQSTDSAMGAHPLCGNSADFVVQRAAVASPTESVHEASNAASVASYDAFGASHVQASDKEVLNAKLAPAVHATSTAQASSASGRDSTHSAAQASRESIDSRSAPAQTNQNNMLIKTVTLLEAANMLKKGDPSNPQVVAILLEKRDEKTNTLVERWADKAALELEDARVQIEIEGLAQRIQEIRR